MQRDITEREVRGINARMIWSIIASTAIVCFVVLNTVNKKDKMDDKQNYLIESLIENQRVLTQTMKDNQTATKVEMDNLKQGQQINAIHIEQIRTKMGLDNK